jgi:hypothetical protein
MGVRVFAVPFSQLGNRRRHPDRPGIGAEKCRFRLRRIGFRNVRNLGRKPFGCGLSQERQLAVKPSGGCG